MAIPLLDANADAAHTPGATDASIKVNTKMVTNTDSGRSRNHHHRHRRHHRPLAKVENKAAKVAKVVVVNIAVSFDSVNAMVAKALEKIK